MKRVSSTLSASGAARTRSGYARAVSETPLQVARPSAGVVLLTLNHPDLRNAMTGPMTEAWQAAMTTLAGDRDLRAVVVTGAGSAFCSGGDTSWIAGDPDATPADLRHRMLPFYRAWLSILDLDVPTIAAVNGPAIGAGLCLALACDLRFAASGARFGAPFVRLGMHPGMAATWLLPEVVGAAHARDLLLTGRTVGADEALRIGLVSRVVEPERLLEEALGAAEQIAATAPLASALTTRALRTGGHADVEAALQWEALAQPVTLAPTTSRRGSGPPASVGLPRFTGR